MTIRNLEQMKKFKEELEKFIEDVNSMCSSLESGVNVLRSFMKDPATVRAMHKAEVAAENIKSVLNPAQHVLEKIKNAIIVAEDAVEIGKTI